MPAPACAAASCGAPIDPPYVSLSNDAIYVLDGDAALKAVLPNGTLTNVRSVPGTAKERAAFAVSPDDSQIAIAIITYSPGSSKLFVENLRGGGHVDVMTSSGTAYWPVGWHQGKIVLASGRVDHGTLLNPFNAIGYALVDPTAGAQPTPLGTGDCTPSGTLTPAGTACIKDPGTQCIDGVVANPEPTPYYKTCLRRIDWSGTETNFLVPMNAYTSSFSVAYAALSVTGQQILTDQLGTVFAPTSATHGGNEIPGSYHVTVPPFPSMGWIDDVRYSFAYVYPDGVTRDRIVGAAFAGEADVAPGVPGSPVTGLLIGTLPARL